jgi:mannosyltransferase OCH1-like enzyme
MIPKIIHLCWFSGDQFPPLIEKCICSWKLQMPDYQIRTWTMKDAKAIGLPFVDEALAAHKWAFAADVVRLHALYTEGGVYLDSDFFVKSDLTPLLTDDFVSSIEFFPDEIRPGEVDAQGHRQGVDYVSGIAVQAAFMASVPGHPFVKQLLDDYQGRHFIVDGHPDMAVVSPRRYARVAEQYGFRYMDMTQTLQGHILIHASQYVAGHVGFDNVMAYGIHACEHSWALSPYKQWLRVQKHKMMIMRMRLEGWIKSRRKK